MKGPVNDKRVERTREALFGAFFELVLASAYDDIKVDDIATRAGVARSTFYEHFDGKNDILAHSLGGPLRILADAVRGPDNTPDLVMILEHFWDNRAVASGIFKGSARRVVAAALVSHIEAHFRLDRIGSPRPLAIPPRLAAIQIAEAMLAPITAWLLGEAHCSAQALAEVLRRTAISMLRAQHLRAPGQADSI